MRAKNCTKHSYGCTKGIAMFFPAKTFSAAERLVPYTLTIEDTQSHRHEGRYRVTQSPPNVLIATFSEHYGHVVGQLAVSRCLGYFGPWPNAVVGKDVLDLTVTLEVSDYENETMARVTIERVYETGISHLADWVVHLATTFERALFFEPATLQQARLVQSDPERAVVRTLIMLADHIQTITPLLDREHDVREQLYGSFKQSQAEIQKKSADSKVPKGVVAV